MCLSRKRSRASTRALPDGVLFRQLGGEGPAADPRGIGLGNADDGIHMHRAETAARAGAAGHGVGGGKNVKTELEIGLVGKYVQLHDAYLSVSQALIDAGYKNAHKINIHRVGGTWRCCCTPGGPPGRPRPPCAVDRKSVV